MIGICLHLRPRQPGRERQGGEDSRGLETRHFDLKMMIVMMFGGDDVGIVYLKEEALEGKEMGSWSSLDHWGLEFETFSFSLF